MRDRSHIPLSRAVSKNYLRGADPLRQPAVRSVAEQSRLSALLAEAEAGRLGALAAFREAGGERLLGK